MDKNAKKGSLKHQIAEEIRKAIFRGELKPGDKVTETRISNDLEVSRGPVREAMQQLVMEGLLVSVTFKETRVSKITTEEVGGLLLPMRVLMETFALKKAYPSWNQQHLEKFEEVLEQMRRAAIFNDLPLFNEVDIQFHELIIRSANMETVANLWDGIVNRIRLYFTDQNKWPKDLQEYTEEHRILLDLFKAGDFDKALQGLKDHIIKTNTPEVQSLLDENELNKEN